LSPIFSHEVPIATADGFAMQAPAPSDLNPWGARLAQVQAEVRITPFPVPDPRFQIDGPLVIAEHCECIRVADGTSGNEALDAEVNSTCRMVSGDLAVSFHSVEPPEATLTRCSSEEIVIPRQADSFEPQPPIVCVDPPMPSAAFVTRIVTDAGASPWELLRTRIDPAALGDCVGAFHEARIVGRDEILRTPIRCIQGLRFAPEPGLSLAVETLRDLVVVPHAAGAEVVVLGERRGKSVLLDIALVRGAITSRVRPADAFFADELGLALHPFGASLALVTRGFGGKPRVRVLDPAGGAVIAEAAPQVQCRPETCDTCAPALSCDFSLKPDDRVTLRSGDLDGDGRDDLALAIAGDSRLFRYFSTSTTALDRCTCTDHGRPIDGFELANLGGTNTASAADLVIADETGVLVQYAQSLDARACLSCGVPRSITSLGWNERAIVGKAHFRRGPYDDLLLTIPGVPAAFPPRAFARCSVARATSRSATGAASKARRWRSPPGPASPRSPTSTATVCRTSRPLVRA